MSAPWSEQVRLGLVHFMVHPECMGGDGPVAATAATLLAGGDFGLLEVAPVNDPAERARLRDAARAAGAGLSLGLQPLVLMKKLDPGSLDPGERAQARDAIRTAMTQADDLGAESVALCSGPETPAATRRASLAAFADTLVAVCSSAGKRPVWLEVFDFDVDKRRLVGPTKEAAELARTVRALAPEFGLVLDLSHLPLQHEDPRAALREAQEVLAHAHAGNCVLQDKTHPRFGDQHPRFGIAGGENDVPELADFIAGLFEIGYLRPGVRRDVSFEVRPGPGESPADLVAHTLHTWEAAWARARR